MTLSGAQGDSQSKRRTEVPGQALGYSLQFTRLTHLLLQAPAGSFCSLELLDDVAQEDETGEVTLIQSKSALTANPAADRAKSLWKTFSNWLDAASSPDFAEKKIIFELYVSRVVGGRVVESFNKAKTAEDARVALNEARTILWGDAPHFPLRGEVAKEISQYVEKVFAAEERIVIPLICNFQLTLGSGSPHEDLEASVRRHPVSASSVSDICSHLCGKVKRHIDKLLESGRPAVIGRDDFHSWYTSYVQKIDRKMILSSRAQAPSEEVSIGHLPDNFIRQLELIELPFEEQLGAINDYLRASFDRTDWALRGEIDESSLDDLNDVLQRSWVHKQRTCGLLHRGLPAEAQGLLLYSDCMQFNAPVQAMSAPGHFIPGCYHMLADELTVGWHPDYVTHLKNKKVT
ncbi:hypothetical protein K5Y32_22600 [Pantoea sp. DY-15]|uniref:ABC-three component system protein n=1 Tax=Pantoea sp. DY-15 TaxID=2871489 RepID=UPI001C97A055|nr:ABC-three component system protein [Pantoea sp. DY-15]MBY4890722.1 hypothetical protein [Pantoea sp. DY-15]